MQETPLLDLVNTNRESITMTEEGKWVWRSIDYRKRNWILSAIDRATEMGDMPLVKLLRDQLKEVDNFGRRYPLSSDECYK